MRERAEDEPGNLKIIEFARPGYSRSAEEAFAIRSHVRQAVIQAKRSQPPSKVLKIIDHIEQVRKRRKRKVAPLSSSLSECSVSSLSAESATALFTAAPHPSTYRGQGSGTIQVVLSGHHPFADFAAKSVNLPSKRLEHLFKSDAFRYAAEPIFDAGHVDEKLNMFFVFPNCQNDALFQNSLVYAMVQIQNGGECSREALSLQGESFRLLHQRLVTHLSPELQASTIGAVMILKSVAYKSNDLQSHRVHSLGLARLLQEYRGKLSTQAQRAIFWLDLFSVLLGLDTPNRCKLVRDISAPYWWQPGPLWTSSATIPCGFARHKNAIPAGVMECISDIVYLRSLSNGRMLEGLKQDERCYRLDSLQASIESRLVRLAPECSDKPIAEAVRLCLFITCFCSFVEVWGSFLIPCRVANNFFDNLNRDLHDFSNPHPWWRGRLDLFLWLLLVSSVVAECHRSHDHGLEDKRDRVLSAIQANIIQHESGDFGVELDRALNDFIFYNEWVDRRKSIRSWSNLEAFCEQGLPQG